MKKKEAAPKPRKKPAAPKKTRVRKIDASPIVAPLIARNGAPHIEFPREGELVVSPEYAFRIAAPQDGWLVEVSVDEGAWRPCRAAVGYWWYDWAGFAPGEHRILCRQTHSSGVVELSTERRCVVEL